MYILYEFSLNVLYTAVCVYLMLQNILKVMICISSVWLILNFPHRTKKMKLLITFTLLHYKTNGRKFNPFDAHLSIVCAA